MSITMRLDVGINKWERMDLAIAHRYTRGWKKAVTTLANMVHAYSDQVIPVDTGYMRSTGRSEVRGDGFRAYALVGYSAHYALFQHETLWWQHKPGQQAKFLEQAVNRVRYLAPRIIYNAIERKIDTGFRYTAPTYSGPPPKGS